MTRPGGKNLCLSRSRKMRNFRGEKIFVSLEVGKREVTKRRLVQKRNIGERLVYTERTVRARNYKDKGGGGGGGGGEIHGESGD